VTLALDAAVRVGWLAARNPLARLAAASIVGLGSLIALDVVTAAVVVALTLVVLATARIPPGLLLRRGWPLLLTAAGVGLTNALLGESGPVDAVGLALRVLAVALPGFAVAVTVDPTALADALVQQGRVSPRFAYGALAALRLLPLLSQEWTTLARARRARGYDDTGLTGRLRGFVAVTLGLLVGSVRRGTRLATAMDARGFDATGPRTVARPQRWAPADTLLVAASPLLPALALATSAAAGTLRLVGG
jgi:energy-coupling factor transport system permease protein